MSATTATTAAANLTLTEAAALGDIIRSCERNGKIALYEVDPDHPLRAVTRCITHDGGALWFDSDGDVRDAYVWLSGTFEHFFPVRQLLTAISEQRLFFQ